MAETSKSDSEYLDLINEMLLKAETRDKKLENNFLNKLKRLETDLKNKKIETKRLSFCLKPSEKN